MSDPGPSARRAVVKGRYVAMNAFGRKAALLHLSYITRDGVEQDGTAGRLYGPAGELELAAFSEPLPGEPHQFRFVIAPENGADLDLTAFTRRLMTQLEADLGRNVRWAAVNHHDTDNPHVHLVVRGLDAEGQPLRIPRDYMSRGFRFRAQELATRELGPRTAAELETQVAREVTQGRLTSIDRELAQLATPDRQVLLLGSYQERLVARLHHLEKMGLANQHGPLKWTLAEGWQESLRRRSMERDIIKQLHLAKHQVDHSRIRFPQSVSELRTGTLAKLVRKSLVDELGERLQGTFLTSDGGAITVPLSPRDAQRLREGEVVTLGPAGIAPVSPQSLTEQITHPGPTWLDRAAKWGPSVSLGPSGLGPELRAAVERRRQVVAGLGIDPRAGNVAEQLEALERQSLGRALTPALSRPFVDLEPGADPTSGRLLRVEKTPNGRHYAIVAQDRGHAFSVAPVARDFASIPIGTHVTIQRDATGRLQVATRDEERSR